MRLFVLLPILLLNQSAYATTSADGFSAYCTGNLDGTGQCVNQENDRRYTCVIIPGQVINCKSNSGKPFQCVWINGVQSNQAEFWCDPAVEAMLADEFKPNAFQVRSPDPLMQKQQEMMTNQGDSFVDPIRSDLGDPFKSNSGP